MTISKLSIPLAAFLLVAATAGDRLLAQSERPARKANAAKTAPKKPAAENSENNKPELPPLKKVTVHVIDPDGKPVAGAHVGLSAHFAGINPAKKRPDADADGFVYEFHKLTDEQGAATLEAGGDDLREFFEDQGIVARHDGRHLAAIVFVAADKAKAKLDVTLVPECRVTGKVTCPELTQAVRPLGLTTVTLGDEDRVMLTCSSDGDGAYHFFVPAGRYRVDASGGDIFDTEAHITVPANKKEQNFKSMVAPAAKLALLIGQRAPALHGIVAWKNSEPVSIASLKGKSVLLFFWRSSQQSSLESVPALIELYDRYKKHGLVIIGVHVDSNKDKTPITTAEQLDARLAAVRKSAWDGKDLPFPVAIASPKSTSYGATFKTTQQARCQAAADYGVRDYPTLLLIDRTGKLVDEIDDSDESFALLEKTLGIKTVIVPGEDPKPKTTKPTTTKSGETKQRRAKTAPADK